MSVPAAELYDTTANPLCFGINDGSVVAYDCVPVKTSPFVDEEYVAFVDGAVPLFPFPDLSFHTDTDAPPEGGVPVPSGSAASNHN
jgi:hypothetical protein